MVTLARYAGQRANTEVEYRDAVPLQRMSEYQEWVENTAVNLNNSAKNRQRSRKITQVHEEEGNMDKVVLSV